MTRIIAPTLPDAGAHGGDALAIAAALGFDPAMVLDLSASLNPFSPDVSALAVDVLRSEPAALNAYPDPARAEAQIADALSVSPDRMVLTNGAAEAIALVAAVVGSGYVVEPEFSLYRRHLARVAEGAPRWRSNPSNPTGVLAAPGESAEVWDEAFYPLATGLWTNGDDRAWRIGSLTKIWSCPGLRLGFVIGPTADEARRVRAIQPQWAVNGLALALVPLLLDRTDLGGWHLSIQRLAASFTVALGDLGFAATSTDVNWVLVDHAGLRAQLAPLGIVVRDCTSFGLPGTHRVALPRPTDVDRVLGTFALVGARR